MTQHALAHWAKRALDLEKVPSQSSISGIIKSAGTFALVSLDASAATKHHRLTAVPCLDRALFQFLSDKNNSGIALNGDFVKFHATNLLNDSNALLHENGKISIDFSNGWIERFTKRYELKFRRVHREAVNAD